MVHATDTRILPIRIRPISVIVPVYNGTQVFKKLITSLESSYPDSDEGSNVGLEFVFLDDGSPDPDLHHFYQQHPFFQRPDVRLKKRAKNLGFIKTVNEAASLCRADSDLVLLNSDTQVWTQSFEKLQEITIRYPQTGSVTPLTNQGTIASLFNWPYGLDTDPYFSPQEIAKSVESLRIHTPSFSAPTGIGFCLYIPRAAWNLVGELSIEFGKGYGEEADWCQRAIRAGFVNLICTETYVHHSGTASFTNEEKQRLYAVNSRLLEHRNPGYNAQVVHYVKHRPLALECVLIITHLVSAYAKKKDPASRTFLFTLHADPWNPEGGGTEKHVKRLIDSLSNSHPSLGLYWLGSRKLELRLFYQGQVFLREQLHVDIVPAFLQVLSGWIDVLHVHHAMYWPESLFADLFSLPIPKKILTVHDYFFLCPSVNLLKDKKEFCSVEPDLEVCNRCLQQSYGYRELTIEGFRHRSFELMKKFDRIIFPSPVIHTYFKRAFAEKSYSQVESKINVLDHELNYICESLPPGATPTQLSSAKRIAFVGHFALHKGSEVIASALDALMAEGFKPEIWGSYHSDISEKKVVAQVAIYPFSDDLGLRALFQNRKPDLVAIPSIWAETFSYVLFESLLLGRVPLVVGPFGNPAYVVENEKVGQVMKSANGPALMEACQHVVTRYSEYSKNITTLVENLEKKKGTYLNSYWRVVGDFVTTPHSLSHSLPHSKNGGCLGLSQFNSIALRQESVGVKAVLFVQAKLQRLPGFGRIEQVLYAWARTGWRYLRGFFR